MCILFEYIFIHTQLTNKPPMTPPTESPIISNIITIICMI